MPIGWFSEWIEAECCERSPWPGSHSLLDSLMYLIIPSHYPHPRWWLGPASIWQTSNPGLVTSCTVPLSCKSENCWRLWPGPFYSPTPALNPGTASSSSVACVLFFFLLPVLYILVASNSILISTFPANAPLEHISLGAESFWPHSLTTPTPRKYILDDKRKFCQNIDVRSFQC